MVYTLRKYFTRFSTAIAVIALAMLGLSLSGTAHAATISGSGFVIGFDGKCLDAANAFGNSIPDAGFTLQMWTCGALGGEDQQFAMVPTTPGFFQLQYQAPGSTPGCVDSSPAGAIILACNAGTPDTWAMSSEGNEYVIQNGSGDVLNVKGMSMANGARVMLYENFTQINDQFMRPVHL